MCQCLLIEPPSSHGTDTKELNTAFQLFTTLLRWVESVREKSDNSLDNMRRVVHVSEEMIKRTDGPELRGEDSRGMIPHTHTHTHARTHAHTLMALIPFTKSSKSSRASRTFSDVS